jgi:hypothetical protein
MKPSIHQVLIVLVLALFCDKNLIDIINFSYFEVKNNLIIPASSSSKLFKINRINHWSPDQFNRERPEYERKSTQI